MLALMSSCIDKEKQEDATNDPQVQDETVMEDTNTGLLKKGCYDYSANGNEVRMEITSIDDNLVEGNLTYAYAEKDKNTGTFKGTLNDDKVIGKYTFMSEGVQSIRDVAFKVDNDQLIEGYGDMDESGTTFKDTSSINYSTTMPLKKVDCMD